MANLTNTFAGLIEEGIKSMNAISDPEKKALVIAELAKAVAATGLVGHMEVPADLAPAESAAEKKAAIKANEPGKQKKAPAPAPKKQEPVAEAPAPVEAEAPAEADGEEWTDATAEKYAEELEFIRALKESYGEDGDAILDQCVSDFSEGNYTSTADITPANIVGFKAYLEMLLQAAEESA